MIQKRIRLSPDVTLGPPPDEKMLKQLAKKGFKRVVNLQNKGEMDQLISPEEEGEQVRELGMEYYHLPVFLASLKKDHVEAFCEEIANGPKPVYVHCRLGQRSIPLTLIYHGLKKELSKEKLFSRAEKLGIGFNSPYMKTFIESYLDTAPSAAAEG